MRRLNILLYVFTLSFILPFAALAQEGSNDVKSPKQIKDASPTNPTPKSKQQSKKNVKQANPSATQAETPSIPEKTKGAQTKNADLETKKAEGTSPSERPLPAKKKELTEGEGSTESPSTAKSIAPLKNQSADIEPSQRENVSTSEDTQLIGEKATTTETSQPTEEKATTTENSQPTEEKATATETTTTEVFSEQPSTIRIRARGIGRLEQRDSALMPRKGSWSVGLFNPLKVQISDDVGIESHPLVALFVAPHLRVWHTWWGNNQMNLVGLYGFSTPSWSLQRGIPVGLGGYFSPSCLVTDAEPDRAPASCQRPGFDLVPQLGTRLSGRQGEGVWTVEGDLAFGLMLTGERPAPLDTYAPIETAFAPTTNRFRGHLGLRYAHRLFQSLSVNIGTDLYLTGQADESIHPSKSPFSLSSQLSFDWAFTEHLSMNLGVIAWLSDQRAFQLVEDQQGFVKKEDVMSLDFFPMFDLLWHY